VGAIKTYSASSSLGLNHWGLVGAGNVAGEFATLSEAFAACLLVFASSQSQRLCLDINQVGSNVVATGSGSIDFTDPHFYR